MNIQQLVPRKTILNTLFVAFLFMLGVQQVNAQVSVGLKTNYGTSWQEYGDLPINGFDQRINSYGFAAEVAFNWSSRFKIKASPGYSRRGAACVPGFAITFPGLIDDATVYADYVDLPIMIEYSLPLLSKFSVFAHAGAGVAYMVGGHQNTSFTDLTRPNERQPLDFSDDSIFNRFDMGLHGGIGFSYDLGPGSLRLSGDYYHGLVDVTTTNTSENRSLAVGLGYTVSI